MKVTSFNQVITLVLFMIPFFSSFGAEKLTWNAFENSIYQNKFSSVESVLEYWSKSDPLFFQNYTLVYHSLSLQESSYENPRALVFGESEELVLTFNGDSNHSRYESIEVLRWNGREFEFRDVSWENGVVNISEPNPRKCLTCHTANAQPIWDSYDKWPRVYGSQDDAIINFVTNKYAHTRFPKEVKEVIEEEYKGIIGFNKNRLNHPRYKYLNPKEGSEVTPYFKDVRGDQDFRPNLKLTKFFAKRFSEKLYFKTKESHCFDQVKALYYGSLLRCQYSSSQKKQWTDTFEALSNALEVKNKWNPKAPWDELNPKREKTSPKSIYTLLGFSHRDFNLGFTAKQWNFFQGEETVVDHLARLVFLNQNQTPILDSSIDIDLIFKYYFYNTSDDFGDLDPGLSELAPKHLNKACLSFIDFNQEFIDINTVLSSCHI